MSDVDKHLVLVQSLNLPNKVYEIVAASWEAAAQDARTVFHTQYPGVRNAIVNIRRPTDKDMRGMLEEKIEEG